MRAASAVCSGRGHALRSQHRDCRPAARNAAFDRDAVRFRPQQTEGLRRTNGLTCAFVRCDGDIIVAWWFLRKS